MSTGMKPQILITGAGGALARETMSRLKTKYRIVAVDFRREVEFEYGIPSYHVDINKRNFEDIFRKHDFDGVLHLGRIGPDVSNRFSRYNTNVLGTQKLLELCRKYAVSQIIVLSTYFVYGAGPYNPSLMDESTPKKASELTQELVDAVELENLCIIYLWKHREMKMTLLRPCNIAGPGIRNSMSLLLARRFTPVLIGFSPMMQFIHINDMARAIVTALDKDRPGIYNVAPNDWIAYQDALDECGCRRLPVPSTPPLLTKRISRMLKWKLFPVYLINYLKYPVIIDGGHFTRTFDFQTEYGLRDIFRYYKELKNKKSAPLLK